MIAFHFKVLLLAVNVETGGISVGKRSVVSVA